jgi:NTP pyrophosphatase (non-canonical NTP hydrolase)
VTVSSIGSHSEFTARAESVTGLKSSSDKKQSAPIGLHPGAELGSRLEGDGVCMQELIDVVARLRAPGGCPWDAEQTHESLVQYLIEETYELVDAIESQDRDAMLEELGDVLYQVLFHADIAAHATDHPFTIDDVARAMTTKMVGRHEHVFGDGGMTLRLVRNLTG